MTADWTVARIRQRLELIREVPELIDRSNSAAVRWVEDVSTLLAEIDRLTAQEDSPQSDD